MAGKWQVSGVGSRTHEAANDPTPGIVATRGW